MHGFVEFTHAKDADGNENMTVNLSFVDWISLALGMNVTFHDGDSPTSTYIPGLKPDGLLRICDGLSQLGGFWPKLCVKKPDNTPSHVVSPSIYTSLNPNDNDALTYYDSYIEEVWKKYEDKTNPLKINIQADGPNSTVKVDNGRIVSCFVEGGQLVCDNDAGTFVRPKTTDIWGCNSGPFDNVAGDSWSRMRVRPRLCAGFSRSTLHLNGVQPSNDIPVDMYYKYPITHHYARLVHESLIDGKGYAFSYDDVNPDMSNNAAGLVSGTHPVQLELYINA
ncbi:hypothetical protein F5Y19DRAFT_448939 [Xylariaceae sp. FL1651]|nr:hypothetical protein F5Y19DRAFT_448939 [Xylariaceae sp. FL1651]